MFSTHHHHPFQRWPRIRRQCLHRLLDVFQALDTSYILVEAICKVDNPLQGLGYFFSSTTIWLCLRWFETASYLDFKYPETPGSTAGRSSHGHMKTLLLGTCRIASFAPSDAKAGRHFSFSLTCHFAAKPGFYDLFPSSKHFGVSHHQDMC
jgi:hypothetical protein